MLLFQSVNKFSPQIGSRFNEHIIHIPVGFEPSLFSFLSNFKLEDDDISHDSSLMGFLATCIRSTGHNFEICH